MEPAYVFFKMSTSTYFLIIAIATFLTLSESYQSKCDDQTDSEVCAQLLKDLKGALLQDEGNSFRIRRLFFQSSAATPVLVKVSYKINFRENLTIAAEVPWCSRNASNSTIELNETDITYMLGWTSSGVYTMFHPTVLSMMQLQFPFSFLRIIHYTLKQRGPEADAFLWDGSYELPTLHINLIIASLSCVPSYELFESVLMDFNSMVRKQSIKFLHVYV